VLKIEFVRITSDEYGPARTIDIRFEDLVAALGEFLQTGVGPLSEVEMAGWDMYERLDGARLAAEKRHAKMAEKAVKS
jgi:hypothetical protein